MQRSRRLRALGKERLPALDRIRLVVDVDQALAWRLWRKPGIVCVAIRAAGAAVFGERH